MRYHRLDAESKASPGSYLINVNEFWVQRRLDSAPGFGAETDIISALKELAIPVRRSRHETLQSPKVLETLY